MNLLRLLAVVLVAGCNVSVQHGVDEAAANEVVSALERGGLSAQKKPDGEVDGSPRFSIEVAQSEAPAAIELLNARGLPKAAQSGFAQIYGEPSLIPTATEERARFLRALSGEIERTLTSVDGVVGARVHLVLQDRDPLLLQEAPPIPARAAVLLRVDPQGIGLTDDQVRALVAGSVSGLVPSAVAVVRTSIVQKGSPAGALVALGPLRVSPASRTPLVVGISLGAAALATMAVLLLVASRKMATRA